MVGEGSLQEKAQQLFQEGIFLGGPVRDFARLGRHCLDVLEHEGMRPSSRVLDVGCGALRVGYWLMQEQGLDTGNYYGIEPNRAMLEVGLTHIVGLETAERAQPHFDYNDRFDFSVFGEQFDFVLARSVWTHAPKHQISTMLESFSETAAPGGVFLASYNPVSLLSSLPHTERAIRQWPKLPLAELSPVLTKLPVLARTREYQGREWDGISHQSDKGSQAGGVRHSLPWIAKEARRHRLKAQLAPYSVLNKQHWLRISRAD